MTTVVVVDDHPAVIAGVRAWCAIADPLIEVLDTGPTAAVAWRDPGRRAGVVVFDLQLDLTGPAYGDLKRLVDDGRQVVVYSMRADQETVLSCLDIGAFTYLTKAEGEDHLVAAIHAAAVNTPYTPPMLSGAFGTDNRPDRPPLSDTESQVLLEWFRCQSLPMVAQILGMAVREVNACLNQVRLKYAHTGRAVPTKTALLTGDSRPAAPPGVPAELTARELQVLTRLACGDRDEDIAVTLRISIRTVRSHLDRVRDKTGLRRRAELTRYAVEQGLIP